MVPYCVKHLRLGYSNVIVLLICGNTQFGWYLNLNLNLEKLQIAGSEWLHLTLLHVLDGKNIATWICCVTYRNRHEGFLVLHLLILSKSLLTVKYGYYDYIF